MDPLSAITGIFSLFGGKKSSGQEVNDSTTGTAGSTNTAATENTSSRGSEQTAGSTQSTTNQSQSGTSTSVGTEATSQNQQTTGRNNQITTNFSDQLLGGLEKLLGDNLAASGGGDTLKMLNERLGGLTSASAGIDPQAYAASIRGAAESNITARREADINSMESQAGGNSGGNSMLALLNQQMSRADESTLAGLESDAFLKAQGAKAEIDASITDQMTQLAGQSNAGLTSLIQAVSGGRQLTQGLQSQSASTVGSATTKDSTASQTNSLATALETIFQQTANQNNTNVTGTQQTNTTGLENVDMRPKGDGSTALLDMLNNMFGLNKPVTTPTNDTKTPTPKPGTGTAMDYARGR